MKWNEVIYADCMNEENGLPTLEDKSIDLCITDPPWNINYDGMTGSSGKKTGEYHKQSKVNYDDIILDYPNFTITWFTEIKRICYRIVIAPGRQNLKLWYEISDPADIFIHYRKNGGYGSRIATYNNFDPYLYFGKTQSFWSGNVLYQNSNTGFLKKNLRSTLIFKHTSPKNINLWYKIIEGINPKSVIDPFMGSGTTAEACTKLGIPWVGYEINEVYSQDINKRLKGCVREPQQIELNSWLEAERE